MERSTLKNLFIAYLNGAMAASVLYLSLSRLIAVTHASTLKIVVLSYWLVVGILFGVASASFLLNWPRKRMLQYIAVDSIIPIVIFIFGVRFYFRAAV
jgi:hypothetical protein